MDAKSVYKGAIAACITMGILTVLVISIAAQSQQRKLDGKKLIQAAPPDSILPDTTQAKVIRMLSVAAMAEKAVKKDSIEYIKEAEETKAMRKNSAALENLVKQKDSEPIRPKSVQLTTNVIKYPDTLTIVIKSEKKGLFKRRKE